MPCRYRTHLGAGTYYALRRAEYPHLIFAEPRDYDDFGAFLAHTLECTSTRLLGYCWMPDAIHLALNIDATPLADVMRRLTRYCSQRIRGRNGATVRYIASFPMMLLEPASHLPMLLRYMHHIPVITGVVENPEEYPYTSHRMYAGKQQGPYMRTTALRPLTPAQLLH